MNHFSDADEIRNSKIEMQPEYYNAFVCESLNERYKIMRNKLPIDPIVEDGKDYFYNVIKHYFSTEYISYFIQYHFQLLSYGIQYVIYKNIQEV